MDALVSYAVSDRRHDVDVVMRGLGYREYHPSGDAKNDLIGATLWKRDTGLLEALQDIKAAACQCQVTLQRAVVVPSVS